MIDAVRLLCLVLIICFAPWLIVVVAVIVFAWWLLRLASDGIDACFAASERRAIKKACANGSHPHVKVVDEKERNDFDMTISHYKATRCRHCNKRVSRTEYWRQQI